MFPVKSASEEITAMLHNLNEGKREVLDDLIPLVYRELHAQAHRYLRSERPNHTLQTTALINEAFLKLTEQKDVKWENRAHFFGLAANIMRRILVDYARAKHRVKRGGKETDLPLEDALSVSMETADEATKIDLILLDEALNKLAKKDLQQAQIVELRYFSGLTVEETAKVLSVSTMTVKRDWNTAKAWLRREIAPNTES
ncbi:MAG: sigma-70 family RNA polymerase sigma factor [Pyrinomonadaceae bacterium]